MNNSQIKRMFTFGLLVGFGLMFLLALGTYKVMLNTWRFHAKVNFAEDYIKQIKADNFYAGYVQGQKDLEINLKKYGRIK